MSEAEALSRATAWLRARLQALAAGEAPGGAPHALALFPPEAALPVLAARLGLTPFEADLLMLGAGMELDTAIGPLCALAQGDPSRPWPCFALGFLLFNGAGWEALSPERPLRQWRLLEVVPAPGAPLVAAPLRAEERIVNHLKGLEHLDERLALLLQPVPPPTVALPASQRAAMLALRAHWQAGDEAPLQLLGADAASKRLIAAHAADRPLYRAAAALLPPESAELARLWRREALLRPVALLLEAPEAEQAEPPLRRFLDLAGPAVALAVRERLAGVDGPVLPVSKPAPEDQRAAWTAALPARPALAARLAAQLDLDAPAIARLGPALAPLPEDAAWEACRTELRPRLAGLAQVIRPRAGWDALVLPAPQRALLRQLAAQVPHRAAIADAWGLERGAGLCALFAGESGTGKTLAAEVLAAELQLDLWRIDLSAVVSKYIGETERNLRALFDSAEQGGAILFFDEADALFGRRSEVKDSHDRYANIEVNYLLQRMEAFRGIAILATNAKAALDAAFLRRLRFVVEFPYPGREERAEIWRRAFPPGAAAPGVAWERLGRLPLTGGSIHTAALNAGFLAAAAGGRVTLPQMLAAARQELVKLDRPVNEADFAPVWEAAE